MECLFINMSVESERNVLWQSLRKLRGLHRIDIKKAGRMRSLAQNRLYWGVYVHSLRMHLAGQGEPVSADLIHMMLAKRFLSEPVYNQVTGEIIDEVPRSTTTLTVSEFNEYLDNIHAYLTDEFGIQIPTIGEFAGRVA